MLMSAPVLVESGVITVWSAGDSIWIEGLPDDVDAEVTPPDGNAYVVLSSAYVVGSVGPPFPPCGDRRSVASST